MLWNPEAEAMPRDALRALQDERLRAAVAYAYERVPFYQERLDAAGVRPAGVRGLDDLPALPFTTKADLRDHYPFGLFAVPRSEVARLHASSGTRGKLTVVGYTRRDLDVWGEVVARCLCLAGARPGDVIHNAYGYGLFTGGLGLHIGGEAIGATVVPMGGGNTPRQVMLIRDFGARVLCCTPSYALTIAEEFERQGVDTAALPLAVGIFGAEPWSDALRAEIERRLNIKATDIYGLSEIIGPGVANECVEAQHGLHVAEDHFYPEVVDPATGAPLPPGEYGELVITSLTKEAFPNIRYRTGDITCLIDEPCVCGRSSRRIARLRGRADDMLIVRGLNVYPSEVEAVLLARDEIAPFYQLVLEREGTLDTLDVQAEVAPAFYQHCQGLLDPALPLVSELRERIDRELRSRLGLHALVTLLPPNDLPRIEAGKVVRVVDRRPK
ncbi:MAG TPA: phenylacetate--CoA ligase [Thermomicrobiales bacterium]|nr:phenylacetate--CoA ligase [Thermomicrobiales bacterium]